MADIGKDEEAPAKGEESPVGSPLGRSSPTQGGGTANVLFCDGHIEILGPDALNESSPLWGARGR